MVDSTCQVADPVLRELCGRGLVRLGHEIGSGKCRTPSAAQAEVEVGKLVKFELRSELSMADLQRIEPGKPL